MSDTPSGQFRIANVAYPYRYASMSDKQLVGEDNGNMVQVDVIDNVKGLVTIYDDSVLGVYIGIDLQKNRVVAYEDPQVLQLSNAGNGYLIHPEDQDKVWVLDNDVKGTAITVEPAPDSNKKYWSFIPL
ncbi:hypothetical protein EV424DRAFT_1561349 [Suillus variegatus]|nr:hypothetical protein EV424DRAFT_1561349 [Suillus variegatus]